ncbi:O-antigen ligase [Aeromicrobium panaciterrae]|uniref:O-antigen ligase n=1 Tax=Aeromicrobium panaciterrae TaxID=363861 RepID=A0ABU1UKM4_9ACTN|nr:O-antigen ligase family protein [Aeromicrobium panaciterrae]MDR7085724.1 O-antigen ligase [Aeromicrobium panaciterrae]
MSSRTPTRSGGSTRRSKRPRSRAPLAPVLVPILVVAFTCLFLLPAAISSPLIAVAVIAMLTLLGYVAAVGFDKASTTMLIMAFGFAPLTLFEIGPRPFVLASFLFAIAFFLALPRLLHEPLRLPGMFMLGAVLFTVMGLISAPLAIDSAVSLAYVFVAVTGLVVIPAAVAWMAPTNRQMWAMMFAFCIGTAISTIYGLPRNIYRNAGFTYHPVALAYTAMLALSFVPYLLTLKVRGRWLFVPPLAAIAVVGVWTSGSRTGLVVLAALVVLIPLLERSLKLGIAVIAGILLIMPTILKATGDKSNTSALSRLFGGGGAQDSDTTRLSTLRDALDQVQQNPLFGNGYSTEHTYVIHNIYLQVLAAEGLIGLIGLILIFSAMVAPLRKVTAPRRALAYPALAAILAGPFQPNMGDHYLGLSLGLSMVVAVGLLKQPPDDGFPKPEAPRPKLYIRPGRPTG